MASDPIATPYCENSPKPTTTIAPLPTEIPFQIPLLVNENNPLPAGYIPQNGLFTLQEQEMMLDSQTAAALMGMLEAAHADGITVWQISEAYRSVEDQQRIWNEKYQKYLTINGLSEEKALEAVKRRVASPGCSEHHTGLALDITVPGESFAGTEQEKWLRAHFATNMALLFDIQRKRNI